MAVFLTVKCYDRSGPLTSFHDSVPVHVRPSLFRCVTQLRLAARYRRFGTHRFPKRRQPSVNQRLVTSQKTEGLKAINLSASGMQVTDVSFCGNLALNRGVLQCVCMYVITFQRSTDTNIVMFNCMRWVSERKQAG
jgi:hypothetical protein